MKRIRFSLLLVALVVSFMAAPEAFGAKKGNSLFSRGALDKALACDWYDITCVGGKTGECCGDLESCTDYCVRFCDNGLPCGGGEAN